MTVRSVEEVTEACYIAGFRQNALVTIVAIAGAESGYDDAAGWRPQDRLNSDGSRDRGVFQINDKAHRDVSDDCARDLQCSAKEAYRISGGGRNFRPWTTFNTGAYERYTAAASEAARSVNARAPISLAAISDATLPAHDLDQLDTGYLPMGTLDHVLLKGQAMAVNVAKAVTSGDMDMSSTETTQLTFTVADPELWWLRSGLLDLKNEVQWSDLDLMIAAVDVREGKAGTEIAVTCRASAIELLKLNREVTDFNTKYGTLGPSEAVEAIAKDNGLRSFVEPSMDVGAPTVKDDPSIANPSQQPTSDWDWIVQQAQMQGFWGFETGGVIYFARPSFLIEGRKEFKVGWRGAWGDQAFDMTKLVSARRTLDDLNGRVIQFTLPRWRGEQVRPGMHCNLKGVAGYDGSFIVTRVTWPIDGGVQPATVTVQDPIDPRPPNLPAVPLTGAAEAAKGGHSVLDFVNYALRQVGKRYIYGATPAASDQDPLAFDCSSLVQWAAHQVGVDLPRTSGLQYAVCARFGRIISIDEAAHTRGALLFEPADGSQHVGISLGDGIHTIEARGRRYGVIEGGVTDIRWGSAGLIPTMDYGNPANSGLTAQERRVL